MAEIGRRYSGYGAGRKILPVAEVITTIVSGSPGRDGKWRTRISDDRIAVYLQAARKQKALLLLNIQPGRSDFLTEVKADGSSVFLTGESLRARYHESLREAKLAKPGAIERYDFSRFSFVARGV